MFSSVAVLDRFVDWIDYQAVSNSSSVINWLGYERLRHRITIL